MTIYNWGGASSVNVVIPGLRAGDGYLVINGLNPYGGVVTSGTYSSSLSVPMSGLSVAPPVWNGAASGGTPSPTFGVFVVIRTS